MKSIPIDNLDDAGRRLMARMAELALREAYDAAFSDFLTPREQRLCFAAVAGEGQSDRLFFWGGAPGAERRVAVLIPDWLLSDVPDDDPFSDARENFLASLTESGVLELTGAVVPLSLSGSEYGSLTHRDWLGAILALGMERRVLGDLAVLGEHEAIAFVAPRVVPFVTENLRRAGSDAVRAAAAVLPARFVIPRSFEPVEYRRVAPSRRRRARR